MYSSILASRNLSREQFVLSLIPIDFRIPGNRVGGWQDFREI